jgi:hypothetical protein
LEFWRVTATSGLQWVGEVTDNVGRLLFLLALFGGPIVVVAWRSYPVPWVATGVVLVGLVVLGEGAYRAWAETTDAPPRAKGSVRFGTPFQIADPSEKRRLVFYRIPLDYERTQDAIQVEAHFRPFLAGREFVRPAVHSLRQAVPSPWMARDPIMLRHGQTAYIDLVGIQDKGGPDQKCFAVDVINFKDDGNFRDSVEIAPGDYEVGLRVLYSDKPHDETKYALRVSDGPEPLTLTSQ